MSNENLLTNRHVLLFVGDDYEDLEVWYPKLRLEEAGARVTMAGAGPAGTLYHGKHGYPCVSDATIDDMNTPDFDGVILAGGWMPDKLRRDAKVLSLVAAFHAEKKLIAAVCHGGWMAISAKIYDGVRVTGSLGIKDDLENAGAIFEDTSVVVDRHFVSSRKPGDLPDFCKAMIAVLAKQAPK